MSIFFYHPKYPPYSSSTPLIQHMPDTHRRHSNTDWMNFWGLSLNIYQILPFLTGFLLPSLSGLGSDPPHEMLVCLAWMWMRGKVEQITAAKLLTLWPGVGLGDRLAVCRPADCTCADQVTRSELEIWYCSRSGGWKRTRQVGQGKLRVGSQSGG